MLASVTEIPYSFSGSQGEKGEIQENRLPCSGQVGSEDWIAALCHATTHIMLKARPKGITRATLRQYYVQNQMSGATQTCMQKSGSVNVLLSNKPFPRCILLLFQTESWCTAFHTFKKKNLVSQTTNLVCQTKNVQEKPISQRKVEHKYLL